MKWYSSVERKDASLPGVRNVVYQPPRPITPQVHHYLRETEAAVINAQEVARVALSLRQSGFSPDRHAGNNHYPQRCHSMLKVVHEGIDTRALAPNPHAKLTLLEGRIPGPARANETRAAPVATGTTKHDRSALRPAARCWPTAPPC